MIPDSVSYQNFVLVTGDTNDMQRPFIKMFASAKKTGIVEDPYARENGTQIILLTGANDQFRKFFDDKLKADRLRTMGYN